MKPPIAAPDAVVLESAAASESSAQPDRTARRSVEIVDAVPTLPQPRDAPLIGGEFEEERVDAVGDQLTRARDSPTFAKGGLDEVHAVIVVIDALACT